ncbi:MAG: hypothetical protein EOP02_19595 [Proteobacteria bacterium]|nr:MAG: hypothetical protein EOP02_19595 [Pseudomonadota bacterium]
MIGARFQQFPDDIEITVDHSTIHRRRFSRIGACLEKQAYCLPNEFVFLLILRIARLRCR